jgi:uncharacterized protein (TIGR03435 family)
MRAVASTILMVFASGAAYGQAADARPEFEVASVKPSAPIDYARGMRVMANGGPGTPDPGRFMTENLTLYNLLTLAYGTERYQITAPDWTQSSRFDISAKVPEGTTRAQFLLMLQRLLAERFKLAVHHEQKEMQAYELTVEKNGPKFRESADEPAPAPDPPARLESPKAALDKDGFPAAPPGNAPFERMMNGRARWRVAKTSMDAFAQRLAAPVGGPVSDATGLKGKYDFTLFWVSAPVGVNSDDTGPSIFGAIQEQLGLKLTPKKVAVDLLVVDHMEKAPAEN